MKVMQPARQLATDLSALIAAILRGSGAGSRAAASGIEGHLLGRVEWDVTCMAKDLTSTTGEPSLTRRSNGSHPIASGTGTWVLDPGLELGILYFMPFPAASQPFQRTSDQLECQQSSGRQSRVAEVNYVNCCERLVARLSCDRW